MVFISFVVADVSELNADDCCILWFPSFIFMNFFGKQSNLPFFMQELSQEEKHGFVYAWVEYCKQQNTVLWRCAWADHYYFFYYYYFIFFANNCPPKFCWQLFAGHVVGFRPMKRKKNLHEMIIVIPNIVLNVKQC